MRRLAAALAIVVGLPGVALAGTGPDDPPLECPEGERELAPRPDDLPRREMQVVPVREDPGGWSTLTLLVEEPPGDPDEYQIHPASVERDGHRIGGYSRRWPTERTLVSYGLWYEDDDGRRARLPLFILEDAPSEMLDQAAATLADGEIGPFANTLWLAGRLLLPRVDHAYPASLEHYADTPPVHLWTVYRTTPEGELWAGAVRAHDGNARTLDKGDHMIVEGCRRTQVGLVTRTDAGTVSPAGVYLFDRVDGVRHDERLTAHQRITAGAYSRGTEVPITAVDVEHHAEGPPGRRAAHQRDDLSVGVWAEDTYRPLIGVRSEATHAEPPEVQNRLLSLGVWGRAGGFHPQIGSRTRFEEQVADEWVSLFLSAGPGARDIGSWQLDLGPFDAWARFVPAIGATYNDTLDRAGRDMATGVQAQHPSQALATVGIWAPTSGYRPLVGTTYDGAEPALRWLGSSMGDRFADMGPWLASAGAFDPAGGYVPVAGASYEPGTSEEYTAVEEYRAGVFTGPYPAFEPVAGARWSGDHTSGWWAQRYAMTGRVPGRARLDLGPVTPLTGFSPVAGLTAEGGGPDRYGLGAWAQGGFLPMLEACYSPRENGTAAGLAAGSGDDRVPLAWVGVEDDTPGAGVLADCPA